MLEEETIIRSATPYTKDLWINSRSLLKDTINNINNLSSTDILENIDKISNAVFDNLVHLTDKTKDVDTLEICVALMLIRHLCLETKQ